MMKKQSSNERSETSAAAAPFEPGTMHNGVLVVFMLAPDKKKKIFGVKENNSGFEKSMTQKIERWKSRVWYGSTKTRWQ